MDTQSSSDIWSLIVLAGSFVLAIYFMQLIKSFGYMNLGELRRRAQQGSPQAKKVLRARSHGLRLWLLLWSLMTLMVVIMMQMLDHLIENTAVVILTSIAILIGLLFALPWAKWPSPNLVAAARVGNFFGQLLDRLEIVFRLFKPLGLSSKISADSPLYVHSKEDLIDIVQTLKTKTVNPQVQNDLDLTISTLTFHSKGIKTCMTDLSKVKIIAADQILSLQLINDLHASGSRLFPVKNSQTGDFVGVLDFKDLTGSDKNNLQVAQVMKPEIYYVHSQAPLNQVLNAFLMTQHHLFLVTNARQEIKGVITVFGVLQQYMGDRLADPLVHYDDLEAVAQYVVSQTPSSSQKSSQHDK